VPVPAPAVLSARAPARSAEGFYGWRIVALSSVALVLTAPGQTVGVAAVLVGPPALPPAAGPLADHGKRSG
jgi:hypothetical protein